MGRPRSATVRSGALTLVAAGMLLGVTSASAQTNAFVVSSSLNKVTVIDTASTTIRGAVTVGAAPSMVAASADGSWAYVSHPTLSYVTEIDAALMTVTRTIPTAASPGALVVSPDGQHLYVGTIGGVQIIEVSSGSAVATVSLTGVVADMAFSPDGGDLYVANGLLSVIDVTTRVAAATAVPATSLAVMPDGLSLYAASSAGLAEVDAVSYALVRNLPTSGTPGPLALTPDGSRLYAGVQGFTLVSSTYGTFAVAFRNVTVYETASRTQIATISVSALPVRMAVTPDRRDLYMTIPPSTVSVVSVNTNRARLSLAVGAGVSGLAIVPDPNAVIVPYVIDAVNDTATLTTVSTAGGRPIATVLANDTLGGVRATVNNVTLSQVSSTAPGVSLDVATGAIVVVAGAASGAHSVVYEICELASPTNCDRATASLNVREPYAIDAVDDTATSNTGKIALNVLTNDKLNNLPATTGTVRLVQVSSAHSGISLVVSNGGVVVASGTPMGTYELTYQICEIASPLNCDQAVATITVVPYVVDAVNDTGAINRSGGTVVANVLVNDTFGTGAATLSNVRLTLVSSGSTDLVLNTLTGAVTVARGIAQGSYALVYRICEIGSSTNCDDATVAITVAPYIIDAVNDSARGSSKVVNTPLASVLSNDTLGGVRATTSTVSLSLVSLTPASNKIRLDLTDGSVDVLGKTESGYYSLVYRICEIGNPTNCDQATVALDLSGSSD